MNEEFGVQDLIKMLEDESVREVIRKIVNESGGEEAREPKECEEGNSKLEKDKKSELESKINGLELKINGLEKKKGEREKQEEGELKIFIDNLGELQECPKLEIKNNNEEKKMKQILDWILTLFNNNKDKNDELTKEKNELEKNNKKMGEKIKEKDKEIEKKDDEIKEKENRIQGFRTRFEKQIMIDYKYNKLSPETKRSIENIFKNVETVEGFIACGVQESKINSLWEYINQEFIEEKNKDLEDLNDIYQYLLNLFILANDYYEVQPVELNDKFDVDYHTKHPKGLSRGVIKDIIFKGYINKNTKKIIKKTLVVVK